MSLRAQHRGEVTSKADRRHSPLLWQISAILVAAAICTYALNFLVVRIARIAAPRAYSLDATTSVLGSGIGIGELDVRLAEPPLPSQQDERDRAMCLALADRLGVEPSAVRVVIAKPPRLIEWQSSPASEQARIDNQLHHTVSTLGEMPDQIVGGFTAAVRLDNEQWRVVRLEPHYIESWRWQYLLWLANTAVLIAASAWITVRRSRRNN